MKWELQTSCTSIISQDSCSLSNSIKHCKCSWIWCVNNTWSKCPISCHKTLHSFTLKI